MKPIRNILFLAAILGLSLGGGQQVAAETGSGLKAPHTQISGSGLQLVRDHGHGGGMMSPGGGMHTMSPPSGGMHMMSPPSGGRTFSPGGGYTRHSFGGSEMRFSRSHKPFIGMGGPRTDRFYHHHRRHHRGSFFGITPTYPDDYYGYDTYNSDYNSCYLNCRNYHGRRYCRTYWRRYCD
jgi:hypothetical protein